MYRTWQCLDLQSWVFRVAWLRDGVDEMWFEWMTTKVGDDDDDDDDGHGTSNGDVTLMMMMMTKVVSASPL